MEGRNLMQEGLEAIGKLEALYERVADFVEPSHLEENPLPTVRAYLSTLRSLERCIELRIKLVREAGRMPAQEVRQALATVDLSRLSDEALREVEEAMVPLGPEPEADGDGDDCRESCKKINENKIVSATAVPKQKETALPAAKATPGKPPRAKPAQKEAKSAGKGSGKPPKTPLSG